jgi:hypothetical protein
MEMIKILVKEMMKIWMKLNWLMEVVEKEVKEIDGLKKKLRLWLEVKEKLELKWRIVMMRKLKLI